VGHAYTRARELCQQVGDTPQRFAVLWGLAAFYNARAALQTAREQAEDLLRLAQDAQDAVLLLQAHRSLGLPLLYLGEVAPARAHLEQGSALYDPQQHRSLVFHWGGADPGVVCRSYAAQALWLLGYPDQALQWSRAALTLAQELGHPFSLAFALSQALVVHQLRREGRTAQEQAEEVIALCTEQGFPQLVAMGTILRGWGLAAQGREEEGIAQMHQGLATTPRGTGLGRPPVLAQLAEAYWQTGQTEAGLHLLAEALTVLDETGERWWEAEVHRLKGELLRRQVMPDEDQAETCFHHALTIARRQEAKALELRTAMSLSRLWQQQGKRAEARQLLAPMYRWFTEGFDTADLQEAKALLEMLA
jgi:predicted ATPase